MIKLKLQKKISERKVVNYIKNEVESKILKKDLEDELFIWISNVLNIFPYSCISNTKELKHFITYELMNQFLVEYKQRYSDGEETKYVSGIFNKVYVRYLKEVYLKNWYNISSFN